MNFVNSKLAVAMLEKYLRAGLVPMIHGSPGIGKSSIVDAVSNRFNLKLIDERLSTRQPTDLMGFLNIKGDKTVTIPMETFPLSTDPLPKDENGEEMEGWLLFLDELTSASKAVQAAAYKLVLDRQVGMHRLHPRVMIVGAGNLSTDGAVVNQMSTAMQSRLVHIYMQSDPAQWIEWASANDIDQRVLSYIRFKRQMLNNFDPKKNNETFACERTWHFLSDVIKHIPDLTHSDRTLVAGVVGDGAATEFIAFTKIYQNMITVDDILQDPMGITIPNEPGTRYAVTGSVIASINDKNADKLLGFLDRMPNEFTVYAIKEIAQKQPQLTTLPLFSKITAQYVNMI